MATGFKDFSRRMFIRGKEVEKNAGRAVRVAALAVDQGVVLATPVDTGRARSNWIVSLGFPILSNVDPTTEGGDAAAQKALSQGAAIISAYRPGLGPVYITNGVPYILALEHGSSRQAPAGMLAQGIASGVAAIRGLRLLGRARRAG